MASRLPFARGRRDAVRRRAPLPAILRAVQPGLHLGLLAAAGFFLLPLVWMVATAFKTPDDIIGGLGALRWVPGPATAENFSLVLGKRDEFPLWRWMGNSLLVSVVATTLVVFVDSLAAFAYARLRWRGRDRLFSLLVGTMLIPGQVLLIPTFLLIQHLGWFDTYWALIVPAGAGVFGVFLLRQFFATLPVELDEAAWMDGCGPFGVYRHVVMPLSRPALAALAIFTFMGTWNAFEGPLIFTNSLEMRTLPIGITIFQGRYNTQYGPMMAAALLASLPAIAAFLLLQRQIIRGISLAGLAGR